MKTTHLILILILIAAGATTRAADQTLAPLPKMTAAEAAETILPEGTIVRVVGTTPADVRVGDGLTAGGIRIGDGIGWQEGQTLTQDLNAGANRITVGTWSLQTIGAWGAISGGELSQSAGKFRLSMGGSIFMEAESELSLVQITRFAWVQPYFELDTISGGASPTITYSTNLISGTWTEVPNVITTTNGATLTHQIDPDDIGTVAFFRATIPSGSGSSVNFTAQILQNGDPVALAGAVTDVSNRVTAVEARTNDWNTAAGLATTAVQPTDAAYTNALALSGSAVQTETDPAWHAGTNAVYQAIGSNTTAIAAMPTNPVTSVVFDGTIYDPVGGEVEITPNYQRGMVVCASQTYIAIATNTGGAAVPFPNVIPSGGAITKIKNIKVSGAIRINDNVTLNNVSNLVWNIRVTSFAGAFENTALPSPTNVLANGVWEGQRGYKFTIPEEITLSSPVDQNFDFPRIAVSVVNNHTETITNMHTTTFEFVNP